MQQMQCEVNAIKVQRRNRQHKARLFIKKENFSALQMNNVGSFTVEAAVIIPLSLFIIAALITLSFALFNRCSLERAVVISSLRGSEEVLSRNQERYRVVEDAVNDALKFNLLAAEDIRKNIEIKGSQVTVSLETEYRNRTFSTYSTKKVLNPVFFIRTCRKIKGVEHSHDAGGI